MARRASSNVSPVALAAGAVGMILVIVAGKVLLRDKAQSFGDVPPLAVEDMMENGNSLRGNEYFIEGKIDEKLRWTPNHGQVVSLRVESRSGEEFIGVEIPAEFNDLNIEREQRYAFRVRVRQGGIPVATGINRL
jgi:hypothetical protein